MSWQADLNEALIGYVIRAGGLVREDSSTQHSHACSYGWQEYGWDDDSQEDTPELTGHMRECAVDLNRSRWEDSDWSEFCGTFAEPPWEQRKGTDAVVWCACGRVQGRRWRYTGGLARLLQEITKEPT